MSNIFADDLARKGLDQPEPAAPNIFAADLMKKGLYEPSKRTQAEWEASPEYARLKAKHDKTVGQSMKLREETGFNPETDDPASRMKALTAAPLTAGEAASSFASGVGTMFEDEANAATLGLYGRARDAIGEKVDPEARRAAKAEMARNREMPGWNIASGVGQAGSAGVGAPGKIYQGAQVLVGAARPVIAGMLAGAATGGAQAGVDAAGREDTTGALKRIGLGAGIGAGVGTGAGLVGKYIGGAPERKAESELGGLKEGVQYKTRLQKFQPNEDEIRVALAERPDIRALTKTDPVAAQPQVQQVVKQKSDQLLNPIYQRMAQVGRDGVPIQTIKNQLLAAKAGFNPIAEKGAVGVIDQMITDFEAHAAQNGGTVPAQFVRETATAFGNQGHANLPNFGQVALPKQVKQDVSGALREAIGDHIESLAGAGPGGKMLRDAYQSANREVSTWLKIRDIVDEKAQRAAGNAPAAGGLVTAGLHAMKHPLMTAAKLVAGKAPDVIDRRILGPAVQSRVGRALAPVGTALQRGAAPVTGNMLVDAARERRRKEAEMAARLTGQAP